MVGWDEILYHENARAWISAVTNGRRLRTSTRCHHEAHAACDIANSIKTEIAVEGQAAGLR